MALKEHDLLYGPFVNARLIRRESFGLLDLMSQVPNHLFLAERALGPGREELAWAALQFLEQEPYPPHGSALAITWSTSFVHVCWSSGGHRNLWKRLDVREIHRALALAQVIHHSRFEEYGRSLDHESG